MITPPGRRSPQSPTKKDTWSTTPRGGQRSRSQISISRSASKRSGTPALEYLRWRNGPESPYSPDKSFVNVPDHDPDLDFELHRDSHFDEGFEGLENVRACCDGRHTVGHSEHHHGTLNGRQSTDNQHLDPNNLYENPRPASLAWSDLELEAHNFMRGEGSFPWDDVKVGNSNSGPEGLPSRRCLFRSSCKIYRKMFRPFLFFCLSH